MKLAVNNFNKGLQTDTHPMIQGTDTLSDCLNGTLITMNGNEIILQNDMGNRRVNNAFLPSGYLPVGMKEYGGVIYIAAYNPITNKSQIGSFPSPLRKINNEINPELLGNSFNFGDVLGKENTYTYHLEKIGTDVIFLDNDVFLIPLTSNIVLHAGDKFIVSADFLHDENTWINITNYKNTNSNNTTKAITPKNRKFTLSLGVLNSQNEFVDITKTLCRWKLVGNGKWEIKNYNSEYSDIFKFNDEYFIPGDFDNSSLDETISDSQLIKVREIERQVLEANTYAYKLVGPLYLKITLNHIETFSFNIYGVNNDDEKQETTLENIEEVIEEDPVSDETPVESAPGDGENNGDNGEDDENDEKETNEEEQLRNVNLQIDAFITYNCPDDADNAINSGNLDYETFDEGTPRFRMFDLIDSPNGIRSSDSLIYRRSVYNPNNNLYSVKLTKKYSGVISESNNYNYFIGVLADMELSKDSNPIYLKGLSVEGTIDLNLLGSGKVIGDNWKFYNTINDDNINIKLLIGLTSYLELDYIYRNLRFKFTDIVSNESYYGPTSSGTVVTVENNIPLFNSSINRDMGITNIIQLDITENDFDRPLPVKKAFAVNMYWDKYNKSDETFVKSENIDLSDIWFLSTELFNEFYRNSKIPNFCDPGLVDSSSSNYNEEFANKMIIRLNSTSDLNDNLETKSEFTGSLVSKDSSNINYRCNNSTEVTFDYNSEIEIDNYENYPDFIVLNNNGENLKLSDDIKIVFDKIKLSADINNQTDLNEYYKREIIETNYRRPEDLFTGSYESSEFDDLFSVTKTENNRHVIITINHNDILIGEGNLVRNAWIFDNFFDYIETHFDDLISYHGIVMNYRTENERYDHFIDVPCKIKGKGDFVEALPSNGMFFNNLDWESEFLDNYDKSDVTRIGLYNDPSIWEIKYTVSDRGRSTKSNMDYYGKDKLFAYLFSLPDYPYITSTYHQLSERYNSSVDNNGSINARVWWKKGNSNNEWVMFNKLLEGGNSDENGYRISKYDFISYLLNNIKNYVYCTNTNSSGALLDDLFYSINGGLYKYTNQHDIKVYLRLKFELEDSQNAENIISGLNNKHGSLIFKFNPESSNVKDIKLNLTSNSKFFTSIYNFSNLNDIPIYIKNGSTCDSKGELLEINYAYYLDSDLKLIYDSSVSRKLLQLEEGVEPLSVLICNSTILGNEHNLLYRYDHIGGGGIPETVLDYTGVELVNNIN